MSLAESISPRTWGFLLAAGGMFVVSTDSLLTRAADVDGFTVTFWFGVFVVPAMLIVSRVGGKSVADIRNEIDSAMWAAGLSQGASTMLFIFAIKNTSIANTVVIIAAAPIMAALVSWIVLRERTSRRVWIAIALSMSGILVVMSGSLGEGALRGDLLAVGAITLWSINLIILRKYPDMDRVLAVGCGGFLMAIFSFVPADIFGHSFTTYLLLFLMGAVGGPLSRVALSTATKYLSAAEVSLFAPIETLAAIMWAWVFFGEVPLPRTYVGGVAVLVAFLVAMTPARSQRRRLR